jgi:TolB protein
MLGPSCEERARRGRPTDARSRSSGGPGATHKCSSSEATVKTRDDFTATRRSTGSAPTWSPDGSRIAFFGDADDDFPDLDEYLYIVDARGVRLRRILDVMFGEQDMTANWSPDGRTLLFARYRQPSPRTALYIVRADGSGLRRLRLEVRDPEWSADGKHIAFTNGGALYVMGANGTRTRRITSAGTYFDW